MIAIKTYRDVVNLWPKRSVLARWLNVEPAAVRGWHARDHIPEVHWLTLVKVARKCGHPNITYALLMGLTPGAALRTQRDGEPAPDSSPAGD